MIACLTLDVENNKVISYSIDVAIDFSTNNNVSFSINNLLSFIHLTGL